MPKWHLFALLKERWSPKDQKLKIIELIVHWLWRIRIIGLWRLVGLLGVGAVLVEVGVGPLGVELEVSPRAVEVEVGPLGVEVEVDPLGVKVAGVVLLVEVVVLVGGFELLGIICPPWNFLSQAPTLFHESGGCWIRSGRHSFEKPYFRLRCLWWRASVVSSMVTGELKARPFSEKRL